jgi:hypothetical protein
VDVTLTAQCFEVPKVLQSIIAGDHPNRPVYIIADSQLPQRFATPHAGYTMPGLDVLLRPWIPDWSGRGFALVIGERKICAVALDHQFRAGLPARQTENCLFLGTALHEATHWLVDRTYTFADVPDYWSADARALREALADHWAGEEQSRQVNAERSPSAKAQQVPPSKAPAAIATMFDKHEGPWIRAAVHVFERAKRFRWPIDLESIVETCLYGLSPSAAYQAALGDEPVRFLNRSFADIRATAPPPAFVQLWKRDVYSWFEALKDSGPEATAKFARLSRCFSSSAPTPPALRMPSAANSPSLAGALARPEKTPPGGWLNRSATARRGGNTLTAEDRGRILRMSAWELPPVLFQTQEEYREHCPGKSETVAKDGDRRSRCRV